MQIKLGCDPEVFIKDNKTGLLIDPRTVGFSGDKENPVDFRGFTLQVDGLAVEFGIIPCVGANDWNYWINQALLKINRICNDAGNYSMVVLPVGKFDKDLFDKVDPESKALGCSPDYNITGKVNESPQYLSNQPIRTAAGHIHIGWSEYEDTSEGSFHFQDALYVAQQFHESGIFAPVRDEEKERLKYYGGNGAFRPKPYGVELRSPSNLWIIDRDSRMSMFNTVYNKMRKIVNE